jgi:hypothetical protein
MQSQQPRYNVLGKEWICLLQKTGIGSVHVGNCTAVVRGRGETFENNSKNANWEHVLELATLLLMIAVGCGQGSVLLPSTELTMHPLYDTVQSGHFLVVIDCYNMLSMCILERWKANTLVLLRN